MKTASPNSSILQKNLSLLVCGYVFLAAGIFLSTELFSAFRIVHPWSIRLFWFSFLLLGGYFLKRSGKFFGKLPTISSSVVLLGLIPFLTFIQGFLSAPNTTDAMVYHLPRVLYWIQEGTAWQTDIFTGHDYMPPFSGYFLLHLHLFFGNDRLVFLSQWLAGVVSLCSTWLLAEKFSKNKDTAFWMTLFMSTLPIFAFQMSSTQVDLVTTAFILCATWFGLKSIETQRSADWLLLSLSGAFAVMTKPTAALWLLPIGLYVLFWSFRSRSALTISTLIVAGVFALVLQLRWLLQNLTLYGSLLGTHRTTGSETLSYSNDTFSVGIALSNVFRNIFLQFPIPVVGRSVENLAERFLVLLGTSLQDPASTWYGSSFHIQSVIFPQEDIVANPVHMALIIAGTGLLLRKRTKGIHKVLLLLCWLGFVLFSLVLRWQPYHSRLLLPFLILGVIFASVNFTYTKWVKRGIVLHVVFTCLLISTNVSRPFFSYTPIAHLIRPLMPAQARIPTSIFTTSREEQYFHAAPYWYEPYTLMSRQLKSAQTIDIEHSGGFLYPLMRLLHAHNRSVQFSYKSGGVILWSGESSLAPEGAECFAEGEKSLCWTKVL